MNTALPHLETRLTLADCFAKASWIALGFAFICLSIDAWAIFGLPHHPISPGGTHGVTLFAVVLWTVEILLAIVALLLVRFAFAQPPQLVHRP